VAFTRVSGSLSEHRNHEVFILFCQPALETYHRAVGAAASLGCFLLTATVAIAVCASRDARFAQISFKSCFGTCRVILSWFPAFDWERTIWRELRQVTDPYLNIFTGIVPPLLGAIDLTPLLGFFVLQALKGYLTVYTDDDIEAWW
jgi:uncharacterized protein YggT (Ycf19 family)